MSVDEVVALSSRFSDMADQVFHRMPLYRRLCEGAAADRDVVERLLLAHPDQRAPNLLLAAVHDVLLASGGEDPLAEWYPSLASHAARTGVRTRPVGHGDADPWPHFRRLALEDPVVERHLRTRATQTNEVGRTLALVPALFDAASNAGSAPTGGIRPLGLVEVGASAGLNLRLDAYGYRYHLAPGQADRGEVTGSVEAIGSAARLVLECQLRGSLVPKLPAAPLPLASAVGIDRNPLEVNDAEDARWLEACQWPEEGERLERLRSAIALAQDDPPKVVPGDAVADVARHVLEVPPHALPVVIATWTLAYLPVVGQQALLAELDQVAEQRDLAMVLSEQPERVPGIPIPPRPDGQPDGRATALVRVEWRGGERTAHRLADQHPHGTWIEWLAT
ncbi:MAG: DUF2332 domain-containing protein [Acidimicrobiales bacterium]